VTNLDDLPIRNDLVGQKPYGAPQLDVPVALNVNENTHRIPEDVAVDIIGRLAAAVLDINRYPDREFLALRVALAKYLGSWIASRKYLGSQRIQ
jgi:histidinol-phosphate aminotransferase